MAWRTRHKHPQAIHAQASKLEQRTSSSTARACSLRLGLLRVPLRAVAAAVCECSTVRVPYSYHQTIMEQPGGYVRVAIGS